MTHEVSLSAAFLLGLLGSSHCIGMCGGLMAAMSVGNGNHPSPGRLQHIAILTGYNIGRISSYTLIGLLMGLLGWLLDGFSRELGMALRLFSGLMLIAMGLYLAGWWLGLTQLEKVGHAFWRRMQPKGLTVSFVSSPVKAIAIGAIWGWLPCGLVYSTLTWAAASGSASYSALLMLVFGLGTLPALLLTGITAKRIQTFLQRRQFRSTAGVLVMLFGFWTIPGPHQMWIMGILGAH